jgi:endonuclease III-like uncharacterized protein
MKFDTIYDEYIDLQKKFDHMRSAANKQTGDQVKQELEMLKTKMEVMKKTHAVELKHAKLYAAREAE